MFVFCNVKFGVRGKKIGTSKIDGGDDDVIQETGWRE